MMGKVAPCPMKKSRIFEGFNSDFEKWTFRVEKIILSALQTENPLHNAL